MNLILTGSLAFDHIMVFRDKFKNHILPEKIHILNVAFTVDNLKKEFGGTAGNIAYTLNLLQEKPIITATAGKDFTSYQKHLDNLKIDVSEIKILENEFTAQCFITTDLDDNQITAFHGGAMLQADQKTLDSVKINQNDWVIISPNGKKAMLQYAQYCQKNDIKFIFDPGQSIPSFSAEELKSALKKSQYVIVNDYEWQLIQNKTGLDEKTIFDYSQTLVITLGEKGSIIKTKIQEITVPIAKVTINQDPTGCGDAYRAGFLFGIKKGFDDLTCGKIASTCAAFAIEKHGTQNHYFTLKNFTKRYKISFDEDKNFN